MRVAIRFVDGEIMEGTSEAATLSKMGFLVLLDGINNRVAWVSLASIKYVLFTESVHASGDADPRDSEGLTKIVLHFVDGEVMRSYKDDTFNQDGEGFTLRLWDPEQKGLIRAIVSLHALKAIFFVNQWDSRSDEEKFTYSAPKEALSTTRHPGEGV